LGVYGGYRYTGIIMGNGNIIDFSFGIMEWHLLRKHQLGNENHSIDIIRKNHS
jgi:hypothetical protein